MSSNCCKDQEKYQQLQAVIDAKKGTKGALMPVMQEAQAIFGYLPKEVQQFIADGLGVTLSEVYGVATFYAQFVLEPQGEHVIGVCLGTACYVKGSCSTDWLKSSMFRSAKPLPTASSPSTPPAASALAVWLRS